MKLLKLDRIGFTYPGSVRPACSEISLKLVAGQTLALMGENGAGKSTLASLINGRLHPDQGFLTGPAEKSVGLVHQRPHRVPGMPLWKVIAVGNKGLTGSWVKKGELKRRIFSLQQRIGSSLNLDRDHASLTPSEAQEAELIEVLLGDPRVLILDEPDMTGLMPLQELLKLLQKEDRSILLITHSLKEAGNLAESTIYLRDGRQVKDAKLFVDHKEVEEKPSPEIERRRQLMDLTEFCEEPLQLPLFRGDRLVILGYKESGLEELEKSLCRNLEQKDFAYIPSDSQKRAQDTGLSLQDNLKLSHRSWHRGWRNLKGERQTALKELQEGGWDFPPESSLQTLSGGNRQRLLLQRESSRPFPLLLAVHPTQGLDSLKKQSYMEKIRELHQKGVIYLTSEPEEALQAASTLAIYFRGKIRSVYLPPFPDEAALLHQMMGAGL